MINYFWSWNAWIELGIHVSLVFFLAKSKEGESFIEVVAKQTINRFELRFYTIFIKLVVCGICSYGLLYLYSGEDRIAIHVQSHHVWVIVLHGKIKSELRRRFVSFFCILKATYFCGKRLFDQQIFEYLFVIFL